MKKIHLLFLFELYQASRTHPLVATSHQPQRLYNGHIITTASGCAERKRRQKRYNMIHISLLGLKKLPNTGEHDHMVPLLTLRAFPEATVLWTSTEVRTGRYCFVYVIGYEYIPKAETLQIKRTHKLRNWCQQITRESTQQRTTHSGNSFSSSQQQGHRYRNDEILPGTTCSFTRGN